ncbi:DUF1707 and DUF4190 domain-containing protein [Plantactinospora solaniradicis]|uniref:DUF1707 and DUF4190 domain-containing protein n=1 Tax=Plantactinospora solaniradicis TaxID=1723736 RepID=A0ABW1KNX1_9ACTN
MDERVGTAQRNTVLELLSQALEQGYLDLSEYEERMTSVHTARTVGDLVRPLVDLPSQFRWDPRGHFAPGAPAPAQARPVQPSGWLDESPTWSSQPGWTGQPARTSQPGWQPRPGWTAGSPWAGSPTPPGGATDDGHGRSVAALALGLVSLPMSICLGAGLLLGIPAIILGWPRRGGRRQSPNATAGLVLGLVGTAVSLVMIATLFMDG